GGDATDTTGGDATDTTGGDATDTTGGDATDTTGGDAGGGGDTTDTTGGEDCTTPETLRAAGDCANLRVGAAVKSALLASEAQYLEVVTAQYNEFTAEFEHKWKHVEKTQDVFTYDGSDLIVDTAEAASMTVKGHALLWHNSIPDWTLALSDADFLVESDAWMTEMVTRYIGRIRAWDVVNEAILGTGADRETRYYTASGNSRSYIADAFILAHAIDPAAQLYYNDFQLLTNTTKADAVFALVSELLEAGVPIHGVGFQSHQVAATAPSVEHIRSEFARFGALGLTVNISELDVQIAELTGSTAENLEAQRQVYQNIASACALEAACVGVTTWGFTDKYSWIDDTKKLDDPLPFDESYQAKPAFDGFVSGLLATE
ncbi:MAG: endo-1,4-beta-xylanase, partial [Myxococcota bacterium]